MIRELAWRIAAYLIACIAPLLIVIAKRRPYSHLSGYMLRYWLFNPYQHADGTYVKQGWLGKHLPSIRVHCILREDTDRNLHDHPWDARTVILRGAYFEQTLTGSDWRLPGHTRAIRFGEFHRISFVDPEDGDPGVFTLFFTWKYMGTWGFLVDGVKVDWRTYLGVAS
mgnify:CR=1 FL=1